MTATSSPEPGARQVAQAAATPADRFLDRMAEQLRGAAGVAAVYGTAVERTGVTIIPVTRVVWGFGGGGGSSEGQEGRGAGAGSGGGGGVGAAPLGYIEVRDGTSEFKPIRDPAAILLVAPVIVAAGLAAALIINALRRLVRA